MSLLPRGNTISTVEVTHISSHGVWLLTQDKELFMSYNDFPWFKEQPVKGWLTSNNLTWWKKGYPSKSECAGQEGQFIPEMHDPLLNDPEVMQ
jgi:hypothetical protein